MLVEVNKLVKNQISKNFVISVLKQANKTIKNRNVSAVSVALVNDKTIKDLNNKYRKIDQVTDVLAFSDPAEIVICWPQLVRQAKKQKHGRKMELSVLLVHGLLHILGYDHKIKKQRLLMEKKTEEIIRILSEPGSDRPFITQLYKLFV